MLVYQRVNNSKHFCVSFLQGKMKIRNGIHDRQGPENFKRYLRLLNIQAELMWRIPKSLWRMGIARYRKCRVKGNRLCEYLRIGQN
jgi:hypothetical protein